MKLMLLIALIVFAGSMLAASETQTDWQGGPGVTGPVTDWQDRFDISGAMDWDTEPGQLKLIVDRDENPIATANGPYYVIAVDIDADGDMDAAGCAYVSGEIFWVENTNGQGTAWSKHVIGSVSTPRYIAVGDFDENGYKDIVASSDNEDKIVLFLCSPSGWGLSTTIASGFDARQIRAADIDQDGLMDLVGVSSYSGDVCWWRNNGGSSSWNINYIDGALIGAYTCDVGDFNGDGHPDIAAASNSADDICAYISRSPYGYSWSKYTIDANYNNPVSVNAADFNNDGNDDFAVASSSGTGNIRWYDYLDTQSSWTTHQMNGASAAGVYDITAHDMDGDGYPDLTLAAYNENRILWCKNREYMGEAWETFPVSSFFSGALGVSVGDMDGDGVPDVLGCAYNGDKVSWWRVSGFTTPSLLTSSILNIEPEDPTKVEWDYIYWASTTPDGTSVTFRLKTSYNSGSMGSWSSWITSSGDLSTVVAQGGSFLQYQVRLATSNPNTTPSLKDITVLWNPVSIEDEGSAPVDGRKVWLISGNPVSGAFSIGYTVDQPERVSIAVYDGMGRTVHSIADGEMASGVYSAMIPALPAGTYSIVMQTEDSMAAQRVVVTP